MVVFVHFCSLTWGLKKGELAVVHIRYSQETYESVRGSVEELLEFLGKEGCEFDCASSRGRLFSEVESGDSFVFFPADIDELSVSFLDCLLKRTEQKIVFIGWSGSEIFSLFTRIQELVEPIASIFKDKSYYVFAEYFEPFKDLLNVFKSHPDFFTRLSIISFPPSVEGAKEAELAEIKDVVDYIMGRELPEKEAEEEAGAVSPA